ncbi:MAG TPA: hypothetical protein DD638_12340 [Pasteurellaceae bacterium]|nr:hypothetical protein [Pasteurellaceae bacterium]
MKRKESYYTLWVSLLFLFTNSVFSASSELAPRIGMSPLDRAKVHSVQAQNWARIGTAEADANNVSDSATTTSGNSAIGSKNCTTNIGTTTVNKGLSSGRYGPNSRSDNIVVVKGDVISLCK